jgi:surface carbohydrate biosynthesis protein
MIGRSSAHPRIALLVDHPDRDLPGLVLTAVELCHQGAICHLVPANLGWKEIWSLAPDFTLFNYFRRSNEPLGRALAEAGMAFGALDTEGGVWPDFDGYTELLWKDPELRSQAACVCLWGRRMASHLAQEQFFRAEQMVVTGCPRFDFYHPLWHGVIEANGRKLGASGGRQVLINTNFSTRNPRFATVEQKIDTSIRNFGWSRERVQSLLDTEEQAITEFIALAGRLARDLPAIQVLVRPHPFEDPSWYRRELSGLANVAVNNDGPVQPAIFASAALVQRSCTTGIEAGLAGLPTFSPQWVPAPMLMPVAEAVSMPCASYEEVASGVEAAIAGRYNPALSITRAIESVVSDWFYAIDGSSYRRVADTVLQALPPSRAVPPGLQERHLYLADGGGTPLRGIAAIGGRVRLAARLSPDWSFRSMSAQPAMGWTRTTKYFSAERVQGLVDRVLEARRQASVGVSRVSAEFARVRGDCRHGMFSHSVTLSPQDQRRVG